MDSAQVSAASPRSGRGWIAGSAVFLVLTGLLTMFRERASAKTTAYLFGTFLGGAAAGAAIGLIIYWIASKIRRTTPRPSAAKFVFWTAFVGFLLNFLSFVGEAMNPRAASAQSAFTTEERQGLSVNKDSIKHVGLGFALPHPGPTFAANREVEQLLAGQFGGQLPPDLMNWAFRDTVSGEVLIIQVTKLP